MTDAETGELCEVVDVNVLDMQPYDFRQAKASALSATREYHRLVHQYTAAISARATAEGNYRRALAVEMLKAKVEHGATMAESVAKGTEVVSTAHEAMLCAEGNVYAAVELMRLCRDNRVTISQLTVWSRQYDSGNTFPPEVTS